MRGRGKTGRAKACKAWVDDSWGPSGDCIAHVPELAQWRWGGWEFEPQNCHFSVTEINSRGSNFLITSGRPCLRPSTLLSLVGFSGRDTAAPTQKSWACRLLSTDTAGDFWAGGHIRLWQHLLQGANRGDFRAAAPTDKHTCELTLDSLAWPSMA